MKRFSAVVSVLSIAGGLSACSSPPAPPSISYGQWTAPRIPYERCLDLGSSALRGEGFAVKQTFHGWFGNAGPASATVVCYDLHPVKGSVITVNVASIDGIEAANQGLSHLAARIFGNVPIGCTSPVGTWSWANGLIVTVNPDSTMSNSAGQKGTWRSLGDNRYEFRWDVTSIDSVTLSVDGSEMDGTFKAVRASAKRSAQC